MTPPESNKERKDPRFWWTFPPFYKPYAEGIDGGEHDIPAIVANQHRLSVQACMEVVEKNTYEYEHCKMYAGEALSRILSALSEMKEKPRV